MNGFLQRFVLLSCALSIMFAACVAETAANSFDEIQTRGTDANPPGVALRLVTVGHGTTFSETESIRFLLIFTSSKEHAFTVKTNDPGHGDELFIVRSDAPKIKRFTGVHGTIAWDERKYIGRKATEVYSYFRMNFAPGEYSAFIQTHRVAKGFPKPGDYLDSPVVTSDVLHFTVKPTF